MSLNKTAALLVIIAVLASILGYMAYLNYQEEIRKFYEFDGQFPNHALARAQSSIEQSSISSVSPATFSSALSSL